MPNSAIRCSATLSFISASWASRVIRLRELAIPGTLAAGTDPPSRQAGISIGTAIPGCQMYSPPPIGARACLKWRYARGPDREIPAGDDSRSRRRSRFPWAECVPGFSGQPPGPGAGTRPAMSSVYAFNRAEFVVRLTVSTPAT
jgi:hypothetical protein